MSIASKSDFRARKCLRSRADRSIMEVSGLLFDTEDRALGGASSLPTPAVSGRRRIEAIKVSEELPK